MQTNKNKTMAILIAIILTFSMTASIILIPNANAHTPSWNIPSFAYVMAAPNPVGVGQKVMIFMWVDTPMPSAAVTNDIRRHDYNLTITKPDGTTETQQWPIVDDTTGIEFYTYTPTQVGTYALAFEYKGQTYTWSGTYQNDTFIAANATTTFTVQTEQLPEPKSSYPLPQEYWTRPIEGQNTDWYTISSNWLNGASIRSGATSTGGAGFGRFQPDGIAPNSAHVMWSKSVQDGGVVGGNSVGNLGNTYYMGGSYNVRFSGAIAMYGRLYYQEPYGNSGGGGDYVAADLRTGKELWRVNTTATGTSLVPSFGFLYDFDTGNQHGVLPEGLLFTSNFARAYDPSTGVLTTMNITGVPSGTETVGPKGEILRYTVTNIGTTASPNWRLTQWNSSKLFIDSTGMSPANWYSGTVNASLPTYYDYNVSLALPNAASWTIYRDVATDNIMLLIQGSLGAGPRTNGEGANVTAINLKPASFGEVLWTKYYSPTPNNVTRQIIAVDADAGTFVTEDKETMRLTGFSLIDGSQLWSSVPEIAKWDTVRRDTLAAYGNLYAAGFDGILYCYSMKNGTLLWTYGNGGQGNSTYAGLGTAYGYYPIFVDVIANGKVYLGTTEHSPGSPWYKDAQYRCIDAYTGQEIWTMMGWGTGMYVGQNDLVADGFFVFLNCYDLKIYSVGKGPSAITVTAPDIAAPFGTPIMIKGTVTDISAGTTQAEQVARFPNGVPAVSDGSQAQWMQYVYMQKPRPTNATGVPVTLSVVDANGNYKEISSTTSDADGCFSLPWTPDISGQYVVYASFGGSESYWPSHAEDSFIVQEPQATPTPQAEIILPPTEMYFAISTAAIIAAIVIVGAVLALILRKRP